MTENVAPTGHLTTNQRRALDALAIGATRTQAATMADRSRRTLDRWIAEDPAFAEALKQATDLSVKDAGRRLAGLLEEAISAMYYVMKHPDSPAHSRLRAADMITSNLIRLREFHELEARIVALEEKLQ